MGKSATGGHEGYRRLANANAIVVKTDALDHHLHVLLRKAGIGTGIAGYGAVLAGLDTILVLGLVLHGYVWG